MAAIEEFENTNTKTKRNTMTSEAKVPDRPDDSLHKPDESTHSHHSAGLSTNSLGLGNVIHAMISEMTPVEDPLERRKRKQQLLSLTDTIIEDVCEEHENVQPKHKKRLSTLIGNVIVEMVDNPLNESNVPSPSPSPETAESTR